MTYSGYHFLLLQRLQWGAAVANSSVLLPHHMQYALLVVRRWTPMVCTADFLQCLLCLLAVEDCPGYASVFAMLGWCGVSRLSFLICFFDVEMVAGLFFAGASIALY